MINKKKPNQREREYIEWKEELWNAIEHEGGEKS